MSVIRTNRVLDGLVGHTVAWGVLAEATLSTDTASRDYPQMGVSSRITRC